MRFFVPEGTAQFAQGTVRHAASGALHFFVPFVFLPLLFAGVGAAFSAPHLVATIAHKQSVIDSIYGERHAQRVQEFDDTAGNNRVIYDRPPRLVSLEMRRHAAPRAASRKAPTHRRVAGAHPRRVTLD